MTNSLIGEMPAWMREDMSKKLRECARCKRMHFGPDRVCALCRKERKGK